MFYVTRNLSHFLYIFHYNYFLIYLCPCVKKFPEKADVQRKNYFISYLLSVYLNVSNILVQCIICTISDRAKLLQQSKYFCNVCGRYKVSYSFYRDMIVFFSFFLEQTKEIGPRYSDSVTDVLTMQRRG